VTESAFRPAYGRLLDRGMLPERVRRAYGLLAACVLCPRRCHANRLADERGACGVGALPLIASCGPHFGEEAPLVGSGGSGAIFFSGCNLGCLFCQNHEISQGGDGEEVTPQDLASIMLDLQAQDCHNINLVSPTHVAPQVLAAVAIAAQAGLRLPIVYNSGGYDAPGTMGLLDGVIDIYMPDAKYARSEVGRRLSGVELYAPVNRSMIREAHRQVGDLSLDRRGVALRGLLVRHLVLPAGLAGTREVVQFIAGEVSVHTYINIMAQYRPCFRAAEEPLLLRRVTGREYQDAIEAARGAGLYRLDGLWRPGEVGE